MAHATHPHLQQRLRRARGPAVMLASVRRFIVPALALLALLPTMQFARNTVAAGDFRAFYCASHAVTVGENPYDEAPLSRCEGLVPATPAPIPGYFVALLVPLAKLPLPQAVVVWELLLLACIAITIAALAKLTGMGTHLVLAAFALSLGMTSLVSGEIVPVALAALCVSALYVRTMRAGVIAALLMIAMLEPHVALPAVVSALLFVPRLRLPIALVLSVLIVLSLAVLGLQQNARFFFEILPLHVRSELGVDFQYSLSTILAPLTTANVALACGSISYVLMAAAGVILGRRLERDTGDGAFLILVPAGLCLLGGTFIHLVQMPFAIPAVLLLAARYPRLLHASAVSLVLLAVPWQDVRWAPALWIAVVYPVGVIALLRYGDRAARPVMAMMAGACAIFAAIAMTAPPLYAAHVAHVPLHANDAAEVAWQHGLAAMRGNQPLGTWLQRAPTWVGLLLFAYAALTANKQAVPVVGVQQARELFF